MVWALVYVIMAQGTGGGTEMTTWQSNLTFATQQECTEAATKAAPGLMSAKSTYVGPSGSVGGSTPNAVTTQPICAPTAK